MKTYREKKVDQKKKNNRRIWSALGIEKNVNKYGLETVKTALSSWLNFQRVNKKLLKEKANLESQLAEIESKI